MFRWRLALTPGPQNDNLFSGVSQTAMNAAMPNKSIGMARLTLLNKLDGHCNKCQRPRSFDLRRG
jgi:hypothetical protein